MAKDAEQIPDRNNRCIQALKHTIQLSNRPNLLALKVHLTEFTQREAERNFDNLLMDLYLQFIEHHLRKRLNSLE